MGRISAWLTNPSVKAVSSARSVAQRGRAGGGNAPQLIGFPNQLPVAVTTSASTETASGRPRNVTRK